MYVRNTTASTIFKLAIAIFAAVGVTRSLIDWGDVTLRYFTLQSNILIGVAAVYLLADGLVRARVRHAAGGVRVAAYLRGIAMLAISITGIVFHLLLAPLLESVDFNSHILHTIVPIMFVLDWLVFAEKGRFRFREVPVWIVYPLVYLAATLLVAAFHDGFYPYPFMDASANGYAYVARMSGILVAAFVVLGVVYVAVDRGLAALGGSAAERAGRLS